MHNPTIEEMPARPAMAGGADNLRRLAALRWLAIAGQLAAILAAAPLLDIGLPLAPMLAVVALLGDFNLYAMARTKLPAPVSDREFFAQLCVDLVALSVLLFFSGGAANPFVSLYLPPIAVAAAALPPRLAWTVAGLCVGAYSVLAVFNVPLVMPDAERATRLHLGGMWLIFVVSAVLITWMVARMTAAIRTRDHALAAARETALRNERVVALGSLAAGAAHELGTPLATMAVVVGELARRPQTAAEVAEDLALLREQIGQCKAIITGLAERAGGSRAEGGCALPLDAWLEALVARWRTLRPHAIARTTLEGSRPAPQVIGEATLEQALLNLFNNAADASPHDVGIAARWDAQALHIEVCDGGPGIDAAVLRAAGRAFVAPHAEGAGIGLFLAHAAVERLGGRIVLANRAGGGACARVELPLDGIRVAA